MQKLNNKKGYSIVEVICALGIISIMLAFIVRMQLDSMRLRSYNDKCLSNAAVFEAIREELLYNCSYDTIKELGNTKKLFIGENNLNIMSIRALQISDIFCDKIDSTKAYMVLSVVEGTVLKLNLEYHFKLNSKDEIYKCEFLKGNYM